MNAAKRNTANAGASAGKDADSNTGAAVLEPPTDGNTQSSIDELPAAAEGNPGTAVAVPSNGGAVASTEAAAGVSYDTSDYDVDDGLNDFTGDDKRPPIVTIVSSKHPQATNGDPAYIDGCVEGDFLRTVDSKLWRAKEGLIFIPCGFAHRWIEKEPGNGGVPGAYVNSYGENSSIAKQAMRGDFNEVTSEGKKIMRRPDNGNIIRETVCYFGLHIDDVKDPSFDPIVLSLTPGHFSQSRKWIHEIDKKFVKTPDGKMKKMALYRGVWKLTTGYYKPPKGGSAYQSLCYEYLGQIHEVIGEINPETNRNDTAQTVFESAIQFRIMSQSPEIDVDFSTVDDSFDPDSFNEYEAKSVDPDDVI